MSKRTNPQKLKFSGLYKIEAKINFMVQLEERLDIAKYCNLNFSFKGNTLYWSYRQDTPILHRNGKSDIIDNPQKWDRQMCQKDFIVEQEVTLLQCRKSCILSKRQIICWGLGPLDEYGIGLNYLTNLVWAYIQATQNFFSKFLDVIFSRHVIGSRFLLGCRIKEISQQFGSKTNYSS